MFEGLAGDSPVDHGGEVSRCACGTEQQMGLVFGEDAAGGPERGGDAGSRVSQAGHPSRPAWSPDGRGRLPSQCAELTKGPPEHPGGPFVARSSSVVQLPNLTAA